MGLKKIISRLAGVISIARFKGVLPVAICLGLCLVLLDLALLWLAGAAPRAFVLPQIYLDWMRREQAADTVAGLVTAYHSSPGTAKKPFLLYTGLSTAIEGIDPRTLAANDGCDFPVVGICGTGGSMSELLALQQALLRSNLRPSIAVLCIHPEWLAAMLPASPPESLNPLDPLRRADWHEAARRVRWWNWIAQNRFYVNQAAFEILSTARIKLGTIAEVDPWREPERFSFPAHQTNAQRQAQISYFAGVGWFEPSRYAQEENAQSAALRELISKLQDRGVEVLVVLMPEARAFRTRVPAEAKQYLLDYLLREFPTSAPPVFDFQGAIADDLFSDNLHMNAAGRAAFTIQLAQAIRSRRPAAKSARAMRSTQ
jgi:hypothetical protein